MEQWNVSERSAATGFQEVRRWLPGIFGRFLKELEMTKFFDV